MIHSQDFLQALAAEKVVGDFFPFSTGDIAAVEKYIKAIVGRLQQLQGISIEPDFSYYGSGFASYINVRVSQKDASDSMITKNGNRTTKTTKGIVLYISNLSPYWYFGAAEWSRTTENDTVKGAAYNFLRPEDIQSYNAQIWQSHIEKIRWIMSEYGYNLLTQAELERPLDFDVSITSVFIKRNAAKTVWDCFFHWED